MFERKNLKKFGTENQKIFKNKAIKNLGSAVETVGVLDNITIKNSQKNNRKAGRQIVTRAYKYIVKKNNFR